MKYKIIRYYPKTKTKRAIKHGLTLEEAQKYITRARTTPSSTADRSRIVNIGEWYDGYTKETEGA